MTGPLTPDELGDYSNPEFLAALGIEDLKREAAYLASQERLYGRVHAAAQERLRLVMVALEQRDFPEVAA